MIASIYSSDSVVHSYHAEWLGTHFCAYPTLWAAQSVARFLCRCCSVVYSFLGGMATIQQYYYMQLAQAIST